MGSFATFLPSIFAQGRSKDGRLRDVEIRMSTRSCSTQRLALSCSHTLSGVRFRTILTPLSSGTCAPEVSTYSYTDVESKFPLRVLSKRQGPPVITYLQLATAKGQ